MHPSPGIAHARHAEHRFLADSMVAKLGKWLRFLGFDCFIAHGESDRALLEIARDEQRIILTRDSKFVHELLEPSDKAVFLTNEDWQQQLREIITAYRLRDICQPFSRCGLCNALLVQMDAEEIEACIPEGARVHGMDFTRCPACGKYYWRGDHARRMEARIKTLLESV